MIKILTLSGGLGAGKSAIARKLLESQERFNLALSTTTRLQQPRDLPGEYEYLTRDQFEAIDQSGQFAWRTPPLREGDLYGTKKEVLDQALALLEGKIRLMLLVPSVIPQLSAYVACSKPNNYYCFYLSLFIQTSPDVVIQRLQEEGLTADAIEKRLSSNKGRDWKKEMDEAAKIINNSYLTVSNDGKLEEVVAKIQRILEWF